MSTELELAEIQGLILSGYAHLKSAAYLFLAVQETEAARKWLAGLAPRLTSAAPWLKDAGGKVIKPATCLNLAFTRSGLESFAIPCEGFSTEFLEGMAGLSDLADPTKLSNRARRLGDTGPNAPALWDFGGPTTPPVHLLLMLFAADPASLTALIDQVLTKEPTSQGLTVLASQEAYLPDTNKEPFGFRDGMSQPTVEGSGRDGADEEPLIAAGEFILNYRNEYNLLPPMPLNPRLGPNGTYLVYRKLEQDVAAFWNFMYAEAGGEPTLAEWIAAKCVGRWRSGAPLTLAPNEDNPALGADPVQSNKFGYAHSDQAGYGCPVGSHVRRTNPRDSLQPDPAASRDAVSKHRMIRRGRIYGPEYPDDVVDYLTQFARQRGSESFVNEDSSKGLAMVIINADLKRQFEFIQQTWVNDPKFDGLYDTKDPLLANHGEAVNRNNTMTIPRRPLRKEIHDLPNFVTLKGGGYFFLPSVSAVAYIAGL